MRNGYFESHIGEGKTEESDDFGSIRHLSDQAFKTIRSHDGRPKYTEFISYQDALQFVRDNQIGDPIKPIPEFARNLRKKVAELLDIKDSHCLRFYTAIGSPLDSLYGVDGFFELDFSDEKGEKKIIRVTLDITRNPKKTEYKADQIIFIPGDNIDSEIDGEAFSSLITEAAEEIIRNIEVKKLLMAKKQPDPIIRSKPAKFSKDEIRRLRNLPR